MYNKVTVVIKVWTNGIGFPNLSPSFAIHASLLSLYQFFPFQSGQLKQSHTICNLFSEVLTQYGILEIHPECSVLNSPLLLASFSSGSEGIWYKLVCEIVWIKGRIVKRDTKNSF